MANQYRLISTNKADLSTGFNYEGAMDEFLAPDYIFTFTDTQQSQYDAGSKVRVLSVSTRGWLINAEDFILVDGTPVTPDIPDEVEPEDLWSTSVTHTYTFEQYMAEQLRSRYAFIDRPTYSLSNVVLDTYLPRYLYKHNMKSNIHELEYIPSTAVAISPLVAKMLGCKQMELEQMIRFLGYTKKQIKDLLLKVKARDLEFVFVGAGGGGINKAHWLSHMARMSNINYLFKRVHVYDADSAEVSNLFRLPIDPSTVATSGRIKLNIIRPYINHLSKLKPELTHSFIAQDDEINYSNYPSTVFDHEGHREDRTVRTRDNFILFGGPDLESRQNLSNCGSYLASSHSNNDCSIYLNPTQDLNIQIESYGMIQLSPFFMNQLRASIELLTILSDDTLDLSQIDKELFNFRFDGIKKLPTDRNYNFIIQDQVDMVTEEQALNF